ncbi:hypothetical protein HKBW3S25_00731, partial [Candidatus Hakubella thermalkaliphila]
LVNAVDARRIIMPDRRTFGSTERGKNPMLCYISYNISGTCPKIMNKNLFKAYYIGLL